MDGIYPADCGQDEGRALTVIRDVSELNGLGPGPHRPSEFAQKLFAFEAMDLPVQRSDEPTEPYSLQWFLSIENHRHGRQGRWIPRLLEFAKHSGETLLGLGYGLGTDWLQYARNGASVVVCSPSQDHLCLVRRNFELRGLPGRFLHTTPSCLPLENASIDVACISSLLHELHKPSTIVDEVYRVLKPGGKILAVSPARFDVDFWFRACSPWQRFFVPKRRQNRAGFTGRSLRQLFSHFVDHRIHKRHLRRREVPHLWRWLPLSLLERCMGRVLVLKAFKPLSAAMSVRAAA